MTAVASSADDDSAGVAGSGAVGIRGSAARIGDLSGIEPPGIADLAWVAHAVAAALAIQASTQTTRADGTGALAALAELDAHVTADCASCARLTGP